MALSTEDFRILREALTWGYANRWTVEHSDGSDGGVTWQHERTSVHVTRPGRHEYTVTVDGVLDMEPRSAREVVDVLAAVGVLPSDMSSAYREGVDNVTEISIMHAVDAKVDAMWDAFQLAHVQHAIVDRLAHLLKAESPFDLRHAAKEITTVVADVLEREVAR